MREHVRGVQWSAWQQELAGGSGGDGNQLSGGRTPATIRQMTTQPTAPCCSADRNEPTPNCDC